MSFSNHIFIWLWTHVRKYQKRIQGNHVYSTLYKFGNVEIAWFYFNVRPRRRLYKGYSNIPGIEVAKCRGPLVYITVRGRLNLWHPQMLMLFFTSESDEGQVAVPGVRISHFLTVVYFNKYSWANVTAVPT